MCRDSDCLFTLKIPQIYPLVAAYHHHVAKRWVESTATDAAHREGAQGPRGIRRVPHRHAIITASDHLGRLRVPADGVDGPRVALQGAHLLLRRGVEEFHFVVVARCE